MKLPVEMATGLYANLEGAVTLGGLSREMIRRLMGGGFARVGVIQSLRFIYDLRTSVMLVDAFENAYLNKETGQWDDEALDFATDPRPSSVIYMKENGERGITNYVELERAALIEMDAWQKNVIARVQAVAPEAKIEFLHDSISVSCAFEHQGAVQWVLTTADATKPRPGRKAVRMLAITACCQCPHSRNTNSCFHPDTPGRRDQYGQAPFNDGSGQPLRCSRPLREGEGDVWPSREAPPDWCPLPKMTL